MKTGNLWLRGARLLALAFMLFCLIVFIAGVFYYQDFAANHADELFNETWTQEEMESILGRFGLSLQWWIQWIFFFEIVFAAILCGIGFFIFLRKADDWFSLYVAASIVLYGTFSGYSISALAGSFPAWEPILTSLRTVAWLGLLLIIYVFPNSKFVPRWTRWVAALLILTYAFIVFVYRNVSPPQPFPLVILFCFAVAIFSQVYRYARVSNALERQQTKWVVFALLLLFALFMPGFGVAFFPALASPNSSLAPLSAFVFSTASLLFGLIPLSIAIAILRYRLWDIDVLIRKTLVYAVLTATLALIFFGGVALMQQVVGRITGTGESPIIIVLSTLAIAALFSALRRRIQDFIDRRFYRRKYNAEQVLADFAEAARNETDLDALTGKLVEVVSETMQPEQMSLWLRTQGREK